MRQEVLSPQTQVPSAPLFGKVLSLSFLSLQLPRWENGGPEGMGVGARAIGQQLWRQAG